MVKVALIGAGKMGISHLSILGAHPDVEVVGVSDTSKMVIDVFKKYSSFPCFTDYEDMLGKAKPDAVFVAVPTKYHGSMVKKVLENGNHVFAENRCALHRKRANNWLILLNAKTSSTRWVTTINLLELSRKLKGY